MSEQVVKRYGFSLDYRASLHGGAIKISNGDDEPYVLATDYDALHAETEALQKRLTTEQGNAAYWKEQYQVLRADYQRTIGEKADLRTELEAARGLLREVELLAEAREHGYAERQHGDVINYRCANAVVEMLPRIQGFLTDTPAPEAPVVNQQFTAEQGERQEAVVIRYPCRMWDGEHAESQEYAKGYNMALDHVEKLNTTPQPGPDVRGLVEAIATGHPRIDPNIPVPLDEEKHHCEHTLYLERERLHKLLDAHRQAQQGGSHDT